MAYVIQKTCETFLHRQRKPIGRQYKNSILIQTQPTPRAPRLLSPPPSKKNMRQSSDHKTKFIRRRCRGIIRRIGIPCDSGDCVIASEMLNRQLRLESWVKQCDVVKQYVRISVDEKMFHAWLEVVDVEGTKWKIDPTSRQLFTRAPALDVSRIVME